MDKGDNEPEQPSYRQKAPAEAIEGPPVTFKDLVERRAAQRNHIFMPKGKQFLGKVMSHFHYPESKKVFSGDIRLWKDQFIHRKGSLFRF